jgi:hypothetical protein
MASTVKSRTNHYEVLGLAPSASDEEIGQAFAREIGRPRAFGGLAELGIAFATLRDPIKRRAYDASLGLTVPEPEVARERVERPRPAEAAPSLEQLIGQLHAAREAAQQDPRGAEDRPGRWSRTAATVGALVIGTMLLGTWAGLEARDDEDAPPAEHVATAKLPPPKPFMKSIVASKISLAEVPAQQAAARAPRRIAHAESPQRPGPEDRLADIAQSLESGVAGDGTTEAAAAEAPSAQAAAASFPLPGKVVARTIERIGYACGEVASTSAVEGASGVYKVTCTSGHSYRAAPVGGRYRFRRLGSR